MADSMKAMDVRNGRVNLVEMPKPTPGKGEVRIKVISSSVNPAEDKVMKGDFVSRFLHARTSPLILGWDFAGIVDAIGEEVNDLMEGNAVWGHLAYSHSQKQGAYAEFIIASEEEVAIKPNSVPFHTAAAAATIAMTSLQSLRDLGKLVEGNRVLIIGSAGGIGSISVGIAKRLGGHVTAVCSTKDIEKVKSLGADVIIDRKKSDPLDTQSSFDVIFDTPAAYSFGKFKNNLQTGGNYITTLPGAALITGMVQALFSSKHCYFVQVASKRADLKLVNKWLSDGLEVPIDSQHKVADLEAALKRQTEQGRSGRVVVNVADGW